MTTVPAIDTLDHLNQQHGIKFVLAFSGGADTKLADLANDTSEQSRTIQQQYNLVSEERIKKIVTDCLRKFDGLQSKIAVQTGGTKGGVPQFATEVAKELGFRTIGIFPEAGAKYFLGDHLIDFSICITPTYQDCCQQVRWQTASHWGDESPVFAKHLDAVVAIGGAAGTAIELAYVLKLNSSILKERH